jgi:hypothetical protein
MSANQSQQADRILLAEKAHRPRWRKAVEKVAPAWFSGEELDLLEPLERDRLYRALDSRTRTSTGTLIIVAAVNAPSILRGLHSESSRMLWLVVLTCYALILIGAWFYRRRSILKTARRDVRDSADWPLRFQNQAPPCEV